MVSDPKAFPILLSEFLCNPSEISREMIDKNHTQCTLIIPKGQTGWIFCAFLRDLSWRIHFNLYTTNSPCMIEAYLDCAELYSLNGVYLSQEICTI